MNWPLIELGELMPGRGTTVNPFKFPDEEFALFSVPAYDCQVPDRVLGKAIGSSKQVIQPEDVLLSKIVPHIRRAWIVPESDERRQIGSSEWIIFRSPKFYGPFLRHVLLSDQFNSKLMQTVSGVGGSLLRARPTGVARIKINLPPLKEQRRIAGILDQSEELRTNRSKALHLLNSLPPALFREWFGNPLENDRGWTQVSVSDFVAGFESGRSIVADDQDESNSAYRVLKVSAVTSMSFRPEESKPLPADYIPPVSHRVKEGDLLFSRANTAELIGATAFVRAVPQNILLPDKLWRFCWTSQPKSHPHFVRFLFQHPSMREEISRRASGTSGSMKNISQDKVLSIRVGLPPLEVQQHFGNLVDHIEKESSRHLASLELLHAVFTGLANQAFVEGFEK